MFAAIDTGLIGCTPLIKTTSFRSFQTGNARNVAIDTHIQWAERNEATDFSILVTQPSVVVLNEKTAPMDQT